MSVEPTIAGLSDRMDGVSDRVDGLSGRMDGLSDRMDGLSDRMDVMTLEMRALGAEVRAGFAESRLTMVNVETKLGARIDNVDRKVEIVIDSLADFRSEYQQHTHE